ncbi:MAG: NAD(P)H-dependent oxidoreductase [Sneathiella sp.]
MKTLLQINTGLQGPDAHSSRLADKATESLLSGSVGMQRIIRDLSREPLPHLDHETFCSFSEPVTVENRKRYMSLSDQLIAELKAADILVIGAPMYNFMIPSTLKSWIDYVVRAGHTFQFGEEGPKGLLDSKQAYIIISQGGSFLGTSEDLQTRYLTMVLGLMGITEIEFIYAQGLAQGPDAVQAGMDKAYQRIDDLVCPSSRRSLIL